MSKLFKETQPLVTHRYYFDVRLIMMGFVALVVAGGVAPMFFSYRFQWMGEGWTILPSVVFLIAMTITFAFQMRNGSTLIKESSERVSSYLRENYGIFVNPKDCAEYCENPYITQTGIVNAEDFNSGEKIRITLKFSKDFTSVTPFAVGAPVAIAPLKLDLKR